MSDTSSLLSFLSELDANNTTAWMHAHQPAYQEAKQNLLAMAQKLIDEIGSFDHTLGELYPQETIFRLAKDTRFSKDKSPYKTNFGIVIAPGGKKSMFPCYYVHLQPGNHSFLAVGLYRPDSFVQKAIRDRLVLDWESFETLLTAKKLGEKRGPLEGDAYKKTPPGYPKDHPAQAYIKQKDRLLHIPLGDKEVAQPRFLDETITNFEIAASFNQRLTTAIHTALKE